MAWRQVVTPNLDPVITQPNGRGGTYTLSDWVGWCLAYVQFSYGAAYAGSPARVSWNSYTKFRHADRDIPVEVYVPLWFSGYYNQWHVLIARFNRDGSGVAWTSPNSAKAAADLISFSSLDSLVSQLKRGWSSDTAFVGWSEDVGGTRVIVSKEDEMTAEELHKYKMGVTFNKMRRLGEGTLKLRAKKESTEVWMLDTEPNWKSGFTYKKGDEFEVVAYVDTNDTRYYVSAADVLNGKSWGVNRNDIEILGTVAPAVPAEFEELKQTVYVKKKQTIS